MPDLLCPVCGKPNPEELEECRFCGAHIQPIPASTPVDSQPIKPGEVPTKRDTSEFEKVALPRQGPIHPGEVPTKKNTAELERALPSWLRSLRDGKRPASGEHLAEPSADKSVPAVPPALPTPNSSSGLPDWLSGLGQVASDSEDDGVPEWLAGLSGDKSGKSLPEPSAEEQSAPDIGNPDWMARLGDQSVEPSAAANVSALQQPAFKATPEPTSDEDVPDWLKSLQSPQPSVQEQPPALQGGDNVPEWLSGLPGISTVNSNPALIETGKLASIESTPDWSDQLKQKPSAPEPEPTTGEKEFIPDWLSGFGSAPATPVAPGDAVSSPVQIETGELGSTENVPDWLDQLKPKSSAPEPDATADGKEAIPDWLSSFGSAPGTPASASGDVVSSPALIETGELGSTENVPDWLDQLKPKSSTPEPEPTAEGKEAIPDWLSSFGSAPGTPASAPGENVPEWMSNLEAKSGPVSGSPAALFNNPPQAASAPPAESPSWLSKLQADVNAADEDEKHKDDFEVVSETPTFQKGTEPLPDWLTKIEPATPASSTTPALIVDSKDNPPSEQGETAFAMEMPDWLSKLNPEQAAEKPAENNESQADSGSPENLETAELPSWVRAMRPVEAVVESKTTPLDESQVTEQSGPLAGMRGVLPAVPGLGPLRKPPTYSTKLQVSDGQHRYAAYLERLVAGETRSRVTNPTRLTSNQILRWLIMLLLFLAVLLPFVIGGPIAPPTSVEPSDTYASSKIINGLTGKAPVLVAFDYEPGLSGELEAVAAPIMDQLFTKGVPLALISTSPTGPALAEHFLQNINAPLEKWYPPSKWYSSSSGEYVNLGYLAGGPVGMLYFADNPKAAMPVDVNGNSAWTTGSLQNVQKLSDFAAVIILTDNADTGRNWIEQTGPYLGNKPMVMVISAQAEPMIRPYFDSGQLAGLVSGLSDAKIYEQSNSNLGPNHQFGLNYDYWDSFSVGILMVELIIVAGAVLGIGIDRRARRKDSKGEA